MAVIDIVVIAVLVLFGVLGMLKGILNSIVSLFGNLASIGVAVLCAKPVSKFLDSIFHIVDTFTGKVASGLTHIAPFSGGVEPIGGDAVLTGAELKEYMPGDTLYNRALKLFVEDSKEFNFAEFADDATANKAVVDYIGSQVAKIIAIIIAAVVVFIMLRIAVLLLARLFNAIGKNKAIGGLDRAVGLLFGLLKGALLVSLVLGIFYLIANETVNGWIEGSTVTKWVYKYVCQFVDWVVTKFNLPKVITDLFPTIAPTPVPEPIPEP